MLSRLTRLPARHGSHGFSLLEILAAMFILGVGILAVLQLFSVSLRTVDKADHHSRASALARSLLEEAYAIDKIEDIEGSFDLGDGFNANRYTELLSTEELEISERELSLYEIRVVVQWPPNGLVELSGKKAVYEKPE